MCLIASTFHYIAFYDASHNNLWCFFLCLTEGSSSLKEVWLEKKKKGLANSWIFLYGSLQVELFLFSLFSESHLHNQHEWNVQSKWRQSIKDLALAFPSHLLHLFGMSDILCRKVNYSEDKRKYGCTSELILFAQLIHSLSYLFSALCW